jgi:hypothetical protein
VFYSLSWRFSVEGESQIGGMGLKVPTAFIAVWVTDINLVAALLTDIVSCMNLSDENLKL